MTALLPGFWVACALLVVAGAAKLHSPTAAVGALDAAGVRVPSSAMRSFGAAELAIGVLAAGWPSTPTATAVTVMYALFAVVVLRLVRSGGAAPCGCFGAVGPEVSAVHGVLNVIACATAVTAAVDPPHGIGWVVAQDPLTALSVGVGIAGCVFAAYLVFTALPGAWRSYGTGQS